MEHDAVVVADQLHSHLSVIIQRQQRRRGQNSNFRRSGKAQLGGHPDRQCPVGILYLYLDAEGARRGVGFSGDIAYRSLDRLAGDERCARLHAGSDLGNVALGHVADYQERIAVNDACDGRAGGDKVAHLDMARLQHAGEGGTDPGVGDIDLDGLQLGPRFLQGRLGAREVGFRAKALLGQGAGGGILYLALFQAGAGLGQSSLAVAHVDLGQDIPGGHRAALFNQNRNDPSAGFCLDIDCALGFGVAVDDEFARHGTCCNRPDTHGNWRRVRPCRRPRHHRLPPGSR